MRSKLARAAAAIGSILGGIALGGAAMPAQAQVDPFVGTWRVTAILNIPEYAPLNLAQARRLIGRTIQVASARVQVWTTTERLPQPDVCSSPEFQTVQGTRQRMLADYRIRQEDLTTLPASFVELTVTCRGNFIIALRQVSPSVLIAELDTVFFRVERTAAGPTVGGGPTQGATPGAIGPSFNCAQARQPDEQLICGDAALARSDSRLAETFGKLVTATAEAQREALRREQREWVSQRGKQCNINADTRVTDANRAALVRCLNGIYATRQRDLDVRLQRAQR
jgi:uncharacterized protein YecT (DUF1311 family)